MKKKVNEKKEKEKEKENPDSKKNIKGKKKGNKKKDAANDDTTTNLPFDRVSPSCILSFSLIHIPNYICTPILCNSKRYNLLLFVAIYILIILLVKI